MQAKFDVQFLAYWFDADSGAAFCLAKAQRPDDMQAVHATAHGLIPNEIISVSEDDLFRFLGKIHDPADPSADYECLPNDPLHGPGGFDGAAARGRAKPPTWACWPSTTCIIRRALVAARGREVKHTGDGVMASFDDVARALDLCPGDPGAGSRPRTRPAEPRRCESGSAWPPASRSTTTTTSLARP